ncbi:BZ3500_MvSof-1268-A1-R1_Chr1-2g01304 [Microbotryum saponariae]|uniref:BZ3500_MvSof-1268-A1-R1_Chr1-2g01304 protein n=1 Tax=Microbotryum saponariae TaxID=289078 RepID=A0A2X0KE72_9BASI|nr:BZ3500_MvSof-1268-A1-R1_Chr1-2g01304 [Microbotryum saponariae]SCZ97033.1 BZ3501_MvSof-1269-A2-R1_Chr1-2g00903 [Microbotryum saponariae]
MSTAPNPADPNSFNHRFVRIPTTQHVYHVVDQAPLHHRGDLADAPTLLLCHGFPDLWFGWRYQIHAFAARGWRVICPSQLGYGLSSAPSDPSHYSYKTVAYDLNLLLNELDVPGQVIMLGHDWGGMVAWRFTNYFPHRVKAIACVCTPYQAPANSKTPIISDEELIRQYRPNFGYQLAFKKAGMANKLDQVGDVFLEPMHSARFRRRPKEAKPEGSEMSSWVQDGRLEKSVERQIEQRRQGKLPQPDPEPELDFYLSTYSKTGFAGPLNWYKTRSINQLEEVASNLSPTFPPHIPALQLPAALDAALPPEMCLAPAVLKCFPGGNLEVRVLQTADHWCLSDENERGKVTEILCEWIEMVLAGKWKPTGNVVSNL